MINRVLDLQSLTVRQIALPLAKMPSVGADTPIAEALALCADRNVARLIVWSDEGKRDRVLGVLSLTSIIYNPEPEQRGRARDHLQPALFIDEGMRLEEAFRRMQKSRSRLAILVGPDQVEAGAISMDDILTAIFGEVRL